MIGNGPILLGQYRPLDSYLHRLDARAKLLPIMLVLVLALLTDSLLFYLLILLTLTVSLLCSGVRPSVLASNFKPILLLVAITFVYHVVFYRGESPELLSVWGWSIREAAVYRAFFFSMRLVVFVSMAFLMTLTNSPSELAEAVAKLLRPLRKIGVPVYDLAIILFIAIRFVPILFDEFVAIRNAQTIRGVSFTGSLISRMKKITYVILPVFVSAVGRADDLAVAMEARGYRTGKERTFYSHATFGWREVWFMALSTLGVGIAYVATRSMI